MLGEMMKFFLEICVNPNSTEVNINKSNLCSGIKIQRKLKYASMKKKSNLLNFF